MPGIDRHYKRIDFGSSSAPRVLLIDDEVLASHLYVDALQDHRFEVFYAKTVGSAIRFAEKRVFDAVVIDVMMPYGRYFGPRETQGGYRTGIVLAREITNHQPSAAIVGLTNKDDADVEAWFSEHPRHYYFHKPHMRPIRFATALWNIVIGLGFMPQIFIVHGHDTEAALSLKNYLQNTLAYPEPTILAEQPSMGMTLIEKFEHYSEDSDIVFALFTPDDFADTGAGRARQNVLFEYGYFLGMLGRRSGRVFLLHKGTVEIPSDLHGIVYIDISRGVEAAGEDIRRELRALDPTV
jgi:CheY-like chemotaxis protein